METILANKYKGLLIIIPFNIYKINSDLNSNT